jgi:Recombination endonuclease VII
MPALSKLYTTKEINKIRDELVNKHGNKCAICNKPGSAFKKKLAVDHAHKSGRIRGLLCFYCNRYVLGRHTQETAKSILDYLLKYDVPSVKTKASK